MQRRPRRQFDVLEVSLVGVLAGLVGFSTFPLLKSPPGPADFLPELGSYAERYGPDRHSQFPEEWLIRDFFGDRRDGFFLDVGANHYKDFSNTYYLESELGWRGIAVEPLTQFAADYAAYRPNTRFRAFFVSDVSNERAKLYVQKHQPLVSSADKGFNERWGQDGTSIDVPTITLDDLLDHEGVERVDFLTMDIELWEPRALAGFDIDRFRPALVCIESHTEVRQQILDYFAAHGYVVVGRYLRADIWNLYFTPLQKKPPTS